MFARLKSAPHRRARAFSFRNSFAINGTSGTFYAADLVINRLICLPLAAPPGLRIGRGGGERMHGSDKLTKRRRRRRGRCSREFMLGCPLFCLFFWRVRPLRLNWSLGSDPVGRLPCGQPSGQNCPARRGPRGYGASLMVQLIGGRHLGGQCGRRQICYPGGATGPLQEATAAAATATETARSLTIATNLAARRKNARLTRESQGQDASSRASDSEAQAPTQFVSASH